MVGEVSILSYLKIAGYGLSVIVFESLGIQQTQIGILVILMLLDFITWIGKQYKIDASQITSHEAWLGIIKKILTLAIIFIVWLLFKGLWIDGTAYINWVLAILIMAEAYSSLQNIYAFRTGTVLPEYDVISILIKTVWNYLKEMIDKTVNKK